MILIALEKRLLRIGPAIAVGVSPAAAENGLDR